MCELMNNTFKHVEYLAVKAFKMTELCIQLVTLQSKILWIYLIKSLIHKGGPTSYTYTYTNGL